MVFHGFWLVSMVFHGSMLVFQGFSPGYTRPKLYPGPTIQSRSAARRAAQDLVYYFCTSIFLYFFAKSDLDLSIVFFCIYFVSFVLFFCQILCFGQGRGAGQE